MADLLEKCAENRIIKAIEEEHYYDDLMNEMMEGDHHSPFLFSLEHGLKYTRFRDYCSLKYTRFRDYSVIKVANSIGELLAYQLWCE